MSGIDQQLARLQSLSAANQSLIRDACYKGRDLDALLAARKDTRIGSPGFWEPRAVQTNRFGTPQAHFTPRPNGEPHPSSPPQEDQRLVLLVVEDEPDDFMLLQRALEKVRAEFEICWCRTTTEALAALDQRDSTAHRICVVADVKLPGTDGFELLRLLRTRPATAQLRFAFLTGRPDPRTKEQAQAAGADAFFVKPTSTDEWVCIARALHSLLVEAPPLSPSGPSNQPPQKSV